MKSWWPLLMALAIGAAVYHSVVPRAHPTDAGVTPVLIIDPGHGGEDGGAVAPDDTRESDLNLDIALRVNALAAFWGLDTVMTRSSDAIAYPAEAQTLSAMKKADQNARISLINSTPGGFLLSIHQNIYPSSAPWGIQVFYGPEPGSEEFAELVQTNMTAQLSPENRRVAEPISRDIYLMRNARCPAVLVECGFLSNPEELAKLRSENYRTELAVVMLASCLSYIRGTTV